MVFLCLAGYLPEVHGSMRSFAMLIGLPAMSLLMTPGITTAQNAQIVGVTVTPHVVAPTLRYSPPRDNHLAARVQLFVQGPAMPLRFAGKTPSQLLQSEEWAWHDLHTATRVPEGALTVWTFNGRSSAWGTGQRFTLEAEGLPRQTIAIAAPRYWISALTFLSSNGAAEPDTLIAHLANQTRRPITVSTVRLYLPRDTRTWHTLWPQAPIPVTVTIPAGDRGYIRLQTGKLPLTYVVVEITTSAGTLWAHQRIKREVFDISGGWVGNHIRYEAFLRLLAHLHVNTAHTGITPGYTDNPALYDRFPLKLFHKLDPIATFDTDAWLPRIHAVEFLGEPQYGGGRPVPPQEVFDALLPYRASRLPTTVTHSEERIWRWYAGLSDYPHYDAYRVVAPAADVWALYDRWGGRRIRWGAPLETIGDLCRSLRELNRPMPCAYWSQGPHHGWTDDDNDGRQRRSPTPDELRAQALHALSTRITSLYWFNLSLKSLLAFPDTWPAIQRIGREIRMLDTLFLEGDAYRSERRRRPDGTPDWDLASIIAPEAALLFALDTAYIPDLKENVFRFGPPRDVTFRYVLPSCLRPPRDVFRVDADGIYPVQWRADRSGVVIKDRRSRDAIYVATQDPHLRDRLEQRRRRALAHEQAHPVDRKALQKLLDTHGD